MGRNRAIAAISSVLPVASLQSMTQDTNKGAREKQDPKISFIPITCNTPLTTARALAAA